MSKEEAKPQKEDQFGKIDECGERAQYHNLVDILFVLDATGSMSWCMDQMKKTVCKVMKKFADKQYDIKFAIELYRDHEPQDFTYVQKHFDLRNLDATIKVIDKECEVGGGGDTPEAVFDGLVNGLKKTSWRMSKDNKTKSKRFLFHGCDAPPHGKQYGCSSSDIKWTEKGCPCGLTRHDVKKLLDEYNVDYTLLKIGSQVDIMSGLFKQCFQNKFKKQIEVKPKKSGHYGYGGGSRVRRTSECYMQEIQREDKMEQCSQSLKKCKAAPAKKSLFSSISDFFTLSKAPMPMCAQINRAPSMSFKACHIKKQYKQQDCGSDNSSDSGKDGKPRSMASLVCSDIQDGVQSYFEQSIKKQKKVTKDI